MSVSVTFSVNIETPAGENVFIVGNNARLGLWNPLKAIKLIKGNATEWSCSVDLDPNTSYSYRYFVGKIRSNTSLTSSDDRKTFDIVQWETHQMPRHFKTGHADSLSLPVTSFGDSDGVHSVGKGWLLEWSEVQIRLYDNPILTPNKGHEPDTYTVRCVPMDYTRTKASQNDSKEGTGPCAAADVLVSNINSKNCQAVPQSTSGITFSKHDFIVFRYRMCDLQQLGFQLDISTCGEDGEPSFLGSSHVLPGNFPASQHVLHLPVIDSHGKPVASINVDVLVARPMKAVTFDMESCDKSYLAWRKPGQKPLDIGHRGMGASFSVDNHHKENTVASFQAAFKWGAHFIETDVLLSKDHCPVIFHDFSVTAALKNKHNGLCKELHEVPVMNLTLEEIQSKKFYSSKGKEINGEEIPLEKMHPFPTLAQILTDVDDKLGFNLEIKYPQMNAKGEMEAENYLDMNVFLDKILETVFQHAKSRSIVFSTFHPDICILLNLKQHRYPVMFLSQGRTNIYPRYKDFRAYSFPNAINFAVSEQILGLVLHGEILLPNLSVIDQVLKNKLLLFVWGDDLNDPGVVGQLRDLKVDGVIYDRMDLNKPENGKPGNTGNGSYDSDVVPMKRMKHENLKA